MSFFTEPQFRKDLLKLLCLGGAILGTAAIFIVTPTLSSPTLLSIGLSILLSPVISAIERRGYSRKTAICLVFLTVATFLFFIGFWIIQSGLVEWKNFKEIAPVHFDQAVKRMLQIESSFKLRHPLFHPLHPTDVILRGAKKTGQWFVDRGPALMGSIVGWLILVPPLTFVLLNEGRDIRRRFFQLVPNRYFESFFLITSDIFGAMSDYLQAKLLEAILVGIMVTIGLAIVQAPYALVLGIVAGITNIIPYLGPFLGFTPALLVIAFDPSYSALLFPTSMVFLFANLVDTLVIFPLIVAKLVNLHPLILLASVAVGQEYYGLVGMLISVPIATTLKVVLQEIYYAVYENRSYSVNYRQYADNEVREKLEAS